MAKQVNINFHQTFKPERQYIGSILDVANTTEAMSIQDISALTGIPNGKSSGKVEPHIMYAKYMGLIDFEKKEGIFSLCRTKLGDMVCTEDPGLQEELTLLLCHALMLRDCAGADMWSEVFKKIIPAYRMGIKKELLLKALDMQFDSKVNTKNFAPFIGSYEDMFSDLNVLMIDSENLVVNNLPYNREYIYLYAYVLFEYWDELFAEQEEISSIQLSTLMFGKAFGWDDQREYEVLEHLADRGIIRLNRQLVPYTIFRLVEKDYLLEKLYSELC